MSDNDEATGTTGVPFHLMPIAAIFGTYAVIATLRAMYQTYQSLTFDEASASPEQKISPPTPIRSKPFGGLLLSILVSSVGYAYVVARVNNALIGSELFDPFDILQLDTSANSTVVKQAYRALSRIHHPDKGGDPNTFHNIHLAYRALSDDVSRTNWEEYGHPDGPQTQTLAFALPDWLLHPEGGVAVMLLGLYIGLFIAIIAYVVKFAKRTEVSIAETSAQSVAGADTLYLEAHLKRGADGSIPTHDELLFLLTTTPESLEVTQTDLHRIADLRKQKLALVARQKEDANKKKGKNGTLSNRSSTEFNLDGGGWADDEDETLDEATKAATLALKQHEAEEKRQAQQLAAATGKIPPLDPTEVKMEGVEPGVLGQEWVERTLTQIGAWPPKHLTKILAAKKGLFVDPGAKDGDRVSNPLDIPAIRRNVIMTIGRLHAPILNTHPQLKAAVQKSNVDSNYFKSTIPFRRRNGLLLEAALRVSIAARDYELVARIIETVAMFKIGSPSAIDRQSIEWFNSVMEKQYGNPASTLPGSGLPRLKVHQTKLETDGEDEIATLDTVTFSIRVERLHAARFLEGQLNICKARKMDPRIAMAAYHEGWWILIRAKLIEPLGADTTTKSTPTSAVDKLIDGGESQDAKLIAAYPMIVSSISKKFGEVSLKFQAPDVPGKYKFIVDIKSAEYLGADAKTELTATVVDSEGLEREEDDDEEDDEEDEEVKKEK